MCVCDMILTAVKRRGLPASGLGCADDRSGGRKLGCPHVLLSASQVGRGSPPAEALACGGGGVVIKFYEKTRGRQ